MTNKLRNQKGFTIIEVLIVLAIAGLILLIVFLAVPALQRNSRNTQRKNQAGAYGSAVNEWVANNNGKVPVTADLTALNALAADGVMTEPTTVTTGAQTGAVTLDTIQIVTTAKCSTTVGDTGAGGNRNIAIRYAVEDSSGSAVKQCLDV